MSTRRTIVVVAAALVLWGCHAIVGIEERGAGGAASTGAAPGTTASASTDATSTDAASITASGTTTVAPDVASATTSGSVYEDVVRSDGPLVYFRFEEASGTAIDAVSNTPQGSIFTYTSGVSVQGGAGLQQGVGSFAPALGNAIRFAGTPNGKNGGYVRFANSPLLAFDGTAPFSVELWASVTFADNSFGYLISNSKDTDMGSDGYWIAAGKDANNDDDDVYAGRAWQTNGSEVGYTAFNAGNPHHYVFTYDGSRTKLYVDGDTDACGSAECTVNGPLSASFDSELIIGGSWNGQDGDFYNGGFVNGMIDEVAVYDYALTPQQIAAHLQAGQ